MFELDRLLSFELTVGASFASEESKTWPVSDEASEFVKDSVVIGKLSSTYGTGWVSISEEFHRLGITTVLRQVSADQSGY